jgi:hypothetical protein
MQGYFEQQWCDGAAALVRSRHVQQLVLVHGVGKQA